MSDIADLVETITIDKAQDIADIAQKSLALKVTDAASYSEAGRMFTVAKLMVKEIESFFKPLKQKAQAARCK